MADDDAILVDDIDIDRNPHAYTLGNGEIYSGG